MAQGTVQGVRALRSKLLSKRTSEARGARAHSSPYAVPRRRFWGGKYVCPFCFATSRAANNAAADEPVQPDDLVYSNFLPSAGWLHTKQSTPAPISCKQTRRADVLCFRVGCFACQASICACCVCCEPREQYFASVPAGDRSPMCNLVGWERSSTLPDLLHVLSAPQLAQDMSQSTLFSASDVDFDTICVARFRGVGCDFASSVLAELSLPAPERF